MNNFNPCSLCPLGCVLSFKELTSRTFTSLQSACHHSCDMHKVLREATERFRARYCDLVRRECPGNTAEQTDFDSMTVSAAEPRRGWKSSGSKRLRHFKCTKYKPIWLKDVILSSHMTDLIHIILLVKECILPT